MIKENGKIVTCPRCGSSDVIRVEFFDYYKMCENPKCPYRSEPEAKRNGWKHTFITGVHN